MCRFASPKALLSEGAGSSNGMTLVHPVGLAVYKGRSGLCRPIVKA